MRKIVLLFSLSIFTLLAVGQVETRSFPNGNAIDQVKTIQKRTKSITKKQMPSFDVQQMLKEDLIVDKMGDAPYRFGKGFDVNYSLQDGSWASTDNGRLWSMNVESQGAISINFIFNNFYLPEGAELYITNKKGTMLYGPVTHKENTNSGFFMTDLIEGDNVTIYLFEPSDQRNKSKLTIERVVHAYRGTISTNVSKLKGYGDARYPHNDVVCYPDWKSESDAVSVILLSNGTELCSGSLLNSYHRNPYFLTAFHCIDSNTDRILSTTEKSNAEKWLFKFHFTRNACGGTSATTGITCNGATFRAAWANTDFALVEATNAPYYGSARASFLGWDRSGATSPQGIGIHHPAGDVMKISFDNQSITTNNSVINFPGQAFAIGSIWNVNFDSGGIEGGSSGSPLFNSDKKVIGQLIGTTTGSYTSVFYGRFDQSWTGGGTDDTRLSNWLDPFDAIGMTANTVYMPVPEIKKGTPDFVNRNEICQFFLDYYRGNQTINWLSNSDMTLISGQGTAWATYRVSSTALGNVKVEANIGTEIKLTKYTSVFYRHFGGVDSYFYGQTSPIILVGGTNTEPTWTYDSYFFDKVSDYNPEPKVWGIMLKSKYNGSTPITTTVTVKQDGVTLSKVVTLKPATTKSLIVEDTPIFKNVRIYNIYGVKVYEEKNTVNFNIENTNLNRGIYFFESTDNEGNIVREKVMKNK